MASAGRVIAGTARGVRLLAPGAGTRPLSDRVKETLFAVLEAASLGPWPVAFLDLFAGSGAGGIEALSRGCPSAVFVERDGGAVRVIRENLRRAGFPPVGSRAPDGVASVRVVQAEAVRFLDAELESADEGAGAPFGAVLVDPPYGDAAMLAALERLGDAGRGWLVRDAVVVAKHFWREAPPERIGVLESRRQRRFGETMLSFYVAGAAR